jgi:two-component system, response regulator
MALMDQNTPEILLIDDNLFDVELIIITLRNHSIVNEIQVLNNGEDALNYIFCKKDFSKRNINNLPKIIILDNKLPKFTGLEVLKKIKEDQRTNKIPVVMLSSSKEEKDIVESYKLGVNSYIVKPIDFNEFTETIYHIGHYWLKLNKTN